METIIVSMAMRPQDRQSYRGNCAVCNKPFRAVWPNATQRNCSSRCTKAAYRITHRKELRETSRLYRKHNREKRRMTCRQHYYQNGGKEWHREYRKEHANELNVKS